MKSGKYGRSFFVLMLWIAAAVFSVGCQSQPTEEAGFERTDEENRLTVFTSHKQEVYDPIIKEFEERTGIWVQVKAGGTTELLEEIREGKGNHLCDIMFGGGVESYEVYKDCFIPYKSSQSEMLSGKYFSGENSWTVFTELPIVPIYNNKLVGEEETARKYIARGADLSIVYPEEGTSSVPDGCAIVRGAPHEENAKRFLEFIASEDVQRLAVEKLYRRSVRLDISGGDAPETGKIVDFDLEWAMEHQQEILETWNRLTEERKGTGAA